MMKNACIYIIITNLVCSQTHVTTAWQTAEMCDKENLQKEKQFTTVWHKCLTGENFDEFDESKLHHQNFSYQ